MARKRKKEKKIYHNIQNKTQLENKIKIKKYLFLTLAIVPILSLIFFAGYYIGYNSIKNDKQELHSIMQKPINFNNNDTKRRLELLKDIELVEVVEKTAVIKKRANVENNHKEEIKETIHTKEKIYTSALHEFDEKMKIPPQNIKREVKIVKEKPKLAIIIDDVSTKSHVNAIKSLNIPITMSFLPPSPARPHSAKLASKEDFYMVHLPMEAQHFTAEEPLTLRIKDSQRKISSRIKRLKKLFPRVKYINNHTGSKFTADEKAMNRLIYALNRYNINFIDSRTTAKTKAPLVLKNFGKKYISRDIFLDNKNEKVYILGQLKKAIKIAKKYGSAIAICHPHSKTILALHSAKKLFKDVELVYINKLD